MTVAVVLAAVLASPPEPGLCSEARWHLPPAVAAERLPDGRVVVGDPRAIMSRQCAAAMTAGMPCPCPTPASGKPPCCHH